MKTITLLVNIVAEYFRDRIEGFLSRKKEPTFLAYSVGTFTNETWLESVYRQGRLAEYLHYGKSLDTFEGCDKVIKAA